MTDSLTRLADEIEAWAGIAARTHQRPDLERIATDLRAERNRLHSWAGLMALLNEHYPADVFPGGSGDSGPRVVALIRECDALRHSARELQRIHDECHQQRDAARAEVESLRETLEILNDPETMAAIREGEAAIAFGDVASIEDLIEHSSLGTPAARRMRERTPPEVARRIVDRAAEMPPESTA